MKKIIFFCLTLIFVISCKHKPENKIENRIENQFELSFMANSNMGELNVKLDGKELESKALITSGKIVAFKAIAKDGFSVDYWKINEKNEYKSREEISIKIEKDTNVVLYFKANPKSYHLTCSCNKNHGSLIIQENGKNIESETSVKEGTNVVFKATPNEDYYIAGWFLNNKPINNLGPTYELKILEDTHVEVNFSEKIKQEIQVQKIVIEKVEYLNKPQSDEKSLSLLENGKEEILISENSLDITIYIESPKDIEAKLIIDDNVAEKLNGNSIVFEKKDIEITEDIKTFKLILSKEGYIEKKYIFRAKKKEIQKPSIPENLRIKNLFVNYNFKKPKKCVEPSDNGIEYNFEFPPNIARCCFCVWIVGENEGAKFKYKNDKEMTIIKADGNECLTICGLPEKGQTKTFTIVLTYNGEEFEYNLNAHIRKE